MTGFCRYGLHTGIVRRVALLVLLVITLFGCMESEKSKAEQADYYYFIGEYKEAIKLWKSLGDDGPRSLYMVGFMYQNGLGVDPSETESIKWYKEALRKGDAKSGIKLYEILVQKGEIENAVHYLRKAAEKGQSRAQLLLAEIYLKEGRMEMYNEWINKAIDQGSVTAKTIKEIRESEVTGAALSYAAKLLKEAMGGDADAYYRYGKIVLSSEKGEEGIFMAVNMFQRAAKRGHPDALYTLGDFYLAGIGVPKDCKKAINFYRRSDSKGNQDAKNRLKEVYNYCSDS